MWCRDGTNTLDSSDDGMLSAVLDVDEVELYLSGKHSHSENKDQLVMPGAQQVSRGCILPSHVYPLIMFRMLLSLPFCS